MDIYQTFSIWKEAVVKAIRYLPIYLLLVLSCFPYKLSNPKIKGALVNDTESLISQYADDTFLVLKRFGKILDPIETCFSRFLTTDRYLGILRYLCLCILFV